MSLFGHLNSVGQLLDLLSTLCVLAVVLVLQVAQAPKASTPQVQAISELELDQAWVPAQPGRNTDINLSLLTSCLLPSAQVGRAHSYRLGDIHFFWGLACATCLRQAHGINCSMHDRIGGCFRGTLVIYIHSLHTQNSSST